MTLNSSAQEKATYINRMFSKIASKYDRMNWIMTGGQYKRWNRKVIQTVNIHPGQTILDIGCGTGDLAFEAQKQCKDAVIIAGDFTLQMMLAGRKRGSMPFTAADAMLLPFENGSFDGVVSGYLARNVGDLDSALIEQRRVLKPGGRIVVLDTTRPKRNLFSPFIWLHMHLVIPFLGRLISGVGEAYQYLPNSSERFLAAEDLAERLKMNGFVDVHFQRLMLGTIAIHWGMKPED